MSISVQERYFSYNKIILLAVGLWPYQQSQVVRFQTTFFLSILISFVILMLSRLRFTDYSFEFNIHLLCTSTYFTFLLIKYISFWLNIETIRYALEQFQDIYKRLKDSKEIAIYNKYGNIGKRITIALIIVAICNHVYLTAIQCGPYILDMIIPKNETYAHHFIEVMTNSFAVQEKDFYLFLLHLNAVLAIGSIAFVAVGTMLLSCFKLICGMFRIASYRFDRAILATLQSIGLKNETRIYKELIYAVDIHRKAMQFAKVFVGDMERSLFFVTMITVLCMSLNFYAIFQIESPVQEIEKIMGHLLLIIFIFIYMFVANYAGQEITDYNNHMFLTVYNTPWYLAPLQIQKLTLFLLQRSNKAFALSLGGLFTLSIECFASLVSASVSYCTLMLSF
ncbi:ObirOr5-9E9 [Ooceraea biroi]|uniref:Odorant receptor n=1 Tax=Ooceraea biroi TaxID=2015173 RepID=A0A026W5L5_OOCBI|nr:odorant receptor 24a-like isoform X1 [Ooceraea biroi]EZA50906.1 hypothetical protein X777_10877 [Ooceraea biroi]RLU26376.1 ObirOr5-9E9 [Ooceraea biroi]